MKRFCAAVAMCAAAAVTLAACGSSEDGGGGEQSVDVVKIAAPLELTGSTGAFGAPFAKAMQLAVDEINERGGIKSLGGAKLELMLTDSQSDPQKAVQLLRQMDRDNPVVAVGPIGSAAAIAAKPVLESLSLPYVTPAAADELTENDPNDNMWRIVSRFSEWGNDTMDFVEQAMRAGKIDIQSIGLVNITTGAGPALSKAINARANELGIEVTEFDYDPVSTKDFGSIVARLRSVDPDLVMGFSYPTDGTAFAKALTLQSWRPGEGFVMTAGAYYLNSFREALGEKTAGWIDASYGATSTKGCAIAAKLNTEFKAMSGGDPLTGLDTTAPSIIAVIADALERAGSTDREAFRQALAQTDLGFCDSTYLLAGEVEFDENNDNAGFHPTFVQHEGAFDQIAVYPKDVAQREPTWPAR